VEKYDLGHQLETLALCPLTLPVYCVTPPPPPPPPPPTPPLLTSLQAAEGQAVLAHKLAGQQARVLADGEPEHG